MGGFDNFSTVHNDTPRPDLSARDLYAEVEFGWNIAIAVVRLSAIVTNLTFVMAVYADRTSKAGPRLLIGNMAFCGFFLTAGLFPVYTLQEWLPSNSTAIPSPCGVISTSFFFATAISWADVCLAVNRTVAICFPFRYNTFRQQKVTWTLILISWSISIIVPVLVSSEIGVIFVDLGPKFCTVQLISGFAKFYTGLSTLIPYGIIAIASVGIFITAHVRLHRAQVDVITGARTLRLLKRRLVIAKAMFASLLWSLICTVPALIMISVPGSAEITWSNPWRTSIVKFSTALLYAVNPVIYFWISTSYRQSFLQAVRWRLCKRIVQVKPDCNKIMLNNYLASGTQKSGVL